MFVTGVCVGVVAAIGAQSYYGCFRRKEDAEEIQNLQLTLQQILAAGAGREASLRAENRELSDRLNEANTRLARRIEEVKTEAIAPPAPAASGTIPPPPPLVRKATKRTREVFIDSKLLVQQFIAFLESPTNKDRQTSVKNALRLDAPTLTRALDQAVNTSLHGHVGKWLKEEKRPADADIAVWEDAVDASLGDHRNEALDAFRFPNANRLVQEAVSTLRQHYRPKSLEQQGSILAELEGRLSKRSRKTSGTL